MARQITTTPDGKAPAPDLSPTVNPGFDRRIRATPMTRTEPPRGYIVSADYGVGTGKAAQKVRESRVNFLYNPSEISVSHTVTASSGILPADVVSDYDVTRYVGKSGGSMSFSLIFDRSYETTDVNVINSAGWVGVHADVAALYDLTGINESRVQVSGSDTGGSLFGGVLDPALDLLDPGRGSAGPPMASMRYRGVMTIRPVYVVLTDQWVPPVSGVPSRTGSMQWYGYISSMDVTYSHWSERMIPIRCGVRVQMQLLVEYSGVA
ncbi:hypothetical protein ACFXDJ_06980 [Streptomyces sp. NPDC059443]|uniref:hypothetical protein n=1 Tax=unclassified Streptomyces TaxID=2593676 RepID=UPI0036CF489E